MGVCSPADVQRPVAGFHPLAHCAPPLPPPQINLFAQLAPARQPPVEVLVAKAVAGLFGTVVRAGSILTLYGIGEGSTNPQLVWGDLTISTPTPPSTANSAKSSPSEPSLATSPAIKL